MDSGSFRIHGARDTTRNTSKSDFHRTFPIYSTLLNYKVKYKFKQSLQSDQISQADEYKDEENKSFFSPYQHEQTYLCQSKSSSLIHPQDNKLIPNNQRIQNNTKKPCESKAQSHSRPQNINKKQKFTSLLNQPGISHENSRRLNKVYYPRWQYRTNGPYNHVVKDTFDLTDMFKHSPAEFNTDTRFLWSLWKSQELNKDKSDDCLGAIKLPDIREIFDFSKFLSPEEDVIINKNSSCSLKKSTNEDCRNGEDKVFGEPTREKHFTTKKKIKQRPLNKLSIFIKKQSIDRLNRNKHVFQKTKTGGFSKKLIINRYLNLTRIICS